MTSSRSLYIELIKKCLTGRIHDPRQGQARISLDECAAVLREAEEIFQPYLERRGQSLSSLLLPPGHPGLIPEILQASLCRMHPDLTPDTMSDTEAIDNLQACVEYVIAHEVEGDLIETGIWKGGLPVLMRAILKAHGITDRTVWAADSFSGLPRPDPEKNLEDAIGYHLFKPLDHLAIPLAYAEGVFRKYDLLDGQVKFLKGWFADTLPHAPIERLALMRLDGDWYESTMTALTYLYPKLSPGGFVIIDDYGLPYGCRRAVDEYRERHGIDEALQSINSHAVYWQKGSASAG